MSKQKKSQPVFSSTRNFKLTHQSLTINDINFKTRTITGNTELTVLPLTSTGKLWRLYLNCKQCRILRVLVQGTLNANYSYVDPTLSICPQDTKKRNLEYYDMCHSEKVRSCDSDCGVNSGELTIKIPKETYSIPGLMENKPLKVMIEFSLENPLGGVQFVIPPGGTSQEAMKHAHVFTYGWENSSRLWFPCVDSYTEPCPWSLCFTVPANMIAVSCGDLTEQLMSTDSRRKTYLYSLTVPTTAPCIAFAVGCFEVYPDPLMQEVTHFCLPGLLPILKNTVQFVSEVFGFFEELLSTRFPHSSYKLVFVDQAYKDALSYSTLGIFSTNLLHSARIIDQVPLSRRIIANAIAEQYFGCYIIPQQWSDWWLVRGVSKFVAGLFCRKSFGNTDYLFWVREEQQKVCLYEAEHSLPPLCGALPPLQTTASSTGGTTSAPPPSSGSRGTFHPSLHSDTEVDILQSRAHLIIRMIQLKIGQDLLLQVFNKLLTLASAGSQTLEWSLWQNLIISTGGFMKLILTVSGKDLSTFMDQWACHGGVARFHASFSFIRKKNMIELKLKQDILRGCPKFVGPMTVVVQEFDGRFPHNIQVEDTVSVHELPCHSKIRKAKKRKVPLTHGEEVEIDISSLDMEVPVLWVRVDPEYQWIRHIALEQSDTVWHCLLKYERDANAQLDALEALEGFQTTQTRDAFRDTIVNSSFFYRVRQQAGKSLAKLLTDTASSGGFPNFIISIVQRLYGSSANQTIVRFNEFSNIAAYLVQKSLPVYIAGIRNVHKQCPKEVVHFLMELFKYNDNQMNKYSDCFLVSGLIDALAETVTPKVAVALPAGVDFMKTPTAALSKEAQVILQEIVQHLNIEKVLPSYKYSITTSCLNCLSVLQRNGHLPSDSSLFRDYAMSNNYIEVRFAAIKAIALIVQAEQTEDDLKFLLDLVKSDPEPRIRLQVLNCLAMNPPFTRRVESKLDSLELVERLWDILCTKFYYDARLRNEAIQVYSSLYSRLTPKCVPQGLGVVIDLKEKVARSSISTPTASSRSIGDELNPLRTDSPTPLQAPSPSLSIKLTPAGDDASSSLAKTSHQHQLVPSLSLKIPTAHLKRISPSFGRGDRERSKTGTASPESVLSASYHSDDSATPSPYTGHRHKRHKGESIKKHKKKKSKKKHKHKHSSRDQLVDVETIDS